MIVLRALGRFFARIGRWIRDTAWVQPLLIVGAIFGLIFSIPHIIDWVGSWFEKGEESQRFYANYQYDLSKADKGQSQVDKLFEQIRSGEAQQTIGDKFFLSFVQEDCTVCEDQYAGYKILTSSSNWGKGEFADLKDEKFKMVTIYIDTFKEVDGKDKNMFTYVWENNQDLFEKLTEGYENSQYAQYKGYTATCQTFANLFESDDDGCFLIEAPTTFMFDYTGSDWSWDGNDIKGLSEIMFSVPGDNEWDKARALHDCWLHKGVFADHDYYNN